MAAPLQWPTTDDVMDQTTARIRTLISGSGAVSINGIRLALPGQLRRFYQQRQFKAAWVDKNGIILDSAELLQALKNSENEGLPVSDYPVATIEHFMNGAIESPLQLAKLDLLLTDSFLHYGSNVRSGRLGPRRVGGEWFIPYKRFDATALLEDALQQHTLGEVLSNLPPSHEGYRLLRTVLQHYRDLDAQGGWPQVGRGQSLRLGSMEPRVEPLRERLRLSGDFKDVTVTDPELFDAPLNDAVQRFQRRHGLTDDGVVGERTREELNLPVKARIRQIEANMERWRWLPEEMPPRYIMVNTAGYDLDLLDGGTPALAMRVIVGRHKRQTPVFTSDVSAVMLNPSWDVPPTIFREDILPQLRRNPARLERLHLRLLYNGRDLNPRSVDWTKVSAYHSPYVLRQDPGPKNPLGRIKFLLHDSDGIYLHDTPDRYLFDRPVRALSSGCIRVEHPLTLALYLLADPGKWDRASLEAAIGLGKTEILPLPESIPIYFTYWTDWVDKDGVLQHREDMYGLDRRLLRLWGKNAT